MTVLFAKSGSYKMLSYKVLVTSEVVKVLTVCFIVMTLTSEVVRFVDSYHHYADTCMHLQKKKGRRSKERENKERP